MIYLITYDLKKPAQDYQNLYLGIKSLGAWWHYLESNWIVSTSFNAQQIFDKLRPNLDLNDRILIVNITRQERQGLLPPQAWQWMVDNEN